MQIFQKETPSLEERLEGWKNRMTLLRTLARIIAVAVQLIIAWHLMK